MDLFDIVSPVERYLADKACVFFQPIGGTLELTPLCNMNCKMCYVRLSKEQLDAEGSMLSAEEWLRIAEEMKQAGVLFLLITGGEPLVYPEFEKLYCRLTEMGFVITINTNGTMLDDHWIELFRQRPCRRLNITLYGKDDETYRKLCNNPTGFSRLMENVRKLEANHIPFRFNCSVTPYNYDQLEELHAIADAFHVTMETACYMFPPARKVPNVPGNFERLSPNSPNVPGNFERLSPEKAGEVREMAFFLNHKGVDHKTVAINSLKRLCPAEDSTANPEQNGGQGLTCRAGRSGFWVNWKGELLPCGMFSKPCISLKDNSFSDSWLYIVKETLKLRRCDDCENCKLRQICITCGAACLTETGSTAQKPEYICRMTEHLYESLIALADV